VADESFDDDFYHDDFYHDDPDQEINDKPDRKKNILIGFCASVVLLISAIFYLPSSIGGSIAVNTGIDVDFGKGRSATVACSGTTSLTMTPYASFTNSAGSLTNYLSSINVSNIPTSCYGVDLTINFYDIINSTPLAIFNSTSTAAVIQNVGGDYFSGIDSTGMTVASSAKTSFTATFTTPVALSSNVFKVTIQSGALTRCNRVGCPGPGGGFIYYVDNAGFDCGATYSPTGSPTGGKCNYLEVAPKGWNTGSDPSKVWAVSAYQSADVSTITNDYPNVYNNALGIGLGYKNSIAIVTQNGAAYDASSNNYAAGAARAYAGGSKSDWYLPTTAELNLLCQWGKGYESSVTTACTSATYLINVSTYGASLSGLVQGYYWSSSEGSSTVAVIQSLFSGAQYTYFGKSSAYYVRPIRAF
jgi:hypothetical protein